MRRLTIAGILEKNTDPDRCLSNLSYSVTFLQFFAVQVYEKPKKVLILSKILYVLMVATIMGFFLSALYAHPSSIIQYCMGTLIIDATISQFIIQSSIKYVKPHLNIINDVIDQSARLTIRRFDSRVAKVLLIYIVLLTIAQIAHTIVTNTAQLIPIFTGFEMDTVNAQWITVNIVLYIVFGYFFLTSIVFPLFYAMTQSYISQFAQLCERIFRFELEQEVPNLQRVRMFYDYHNQLKRSVNDALGLVPFNLFGKTFMFFASGLSFFIIHEHEFDPYFLIVTIGIGTIQVISTISLIVYSCSKATSDFDKARLIASKLSLKDVSNFKARSLLIALIANEPTVQATAWDMFDVNKQVFLNFANALIAFTVMIITSTDQINSHGNLQLENQQRAAGVQSHA